MTDSAPQKSVGSVDPRWRPFLEAKALAQSLEFATAREFQAWTKTAARPADIPSNPERAYASDWVGWADWLGTAPRPFADAREYARSLGLNKRDEWVSHVASGTLPRDIPKWPQNIYKGQGWISWEDWLGRRAGFRFRPFEEAREFVRSLGLTSRREWTAFVQSDACPRDIPSDPASTYGDRWFGFGDWIGNHTRWNRNAILGFLTSLRPIVQHLQPAEVFVILQRKGLIGKRFPTNSHAGLLMSLDRLCTTAAPEATIEELVVQLEGVVATPTDEDPEGSSVSSATTPADDDLVPVAIAALATPTLPPRLGTNSSLRIPDQLIADHVIDDEEVLEFLVNNRVAALWQEALDGDPEQVFGRVRGETTKGVYFQRISERFTAQYAGAVGLPIPADYAFRKHGQLQPPNLMQRLAAYRLMAEKRLGNWSGVGAGKTLSAVLASRVMGAQLTVVVAVNATIDRWGEAIREAFPNSHVHAKDVSTFSIEPSRPNYLLLNFESFQQVWSDQFVQDLTTRHKIDFIVLDEVQLARQRTAAVESKRRSLVRRLLAEAANRNPDLRVLGMSATPVINNLHEAKTLLEMVIGDELHSLPTKPTVDNAIGVHKKLILHGIRYRPRYSATLLTSHPEIDGHPLLRELRQVGPRDLLGLETVLLIEKLPAILAQVKPGTMLYTQFVTGIVDLVRAACEQHGLRVGVFTGEEKSGLNAFRSGEVDVLVGSAPVGTGVDGLQDVCSRLIFISLPWTSAEYEQVVGRLHRQGTQFDQIEVIVPQVVLRHPDGRQWSWDKLRWERIQWKRTLADAATDGVVPQGQLPSKEEMQAQSLAALTEWMRRLEQDERPDGES